MFLRNFSYIAVGKNMAPQVHTLSREARALFESRMKIATATEKEHLVHQALRATFGRECDMAFPCSDEALMFKLAETYVGPHEQRVRGLCAAIALDQPFGPNEKPFDNGPCDAGEREPVEPKGPQPGAPDALQPDAPEVRRKKRIASPVTAAA